MAINLQRGTPAYTDWFQKNVRYTPEYEGLYGKLERGEIDGTAFKQQSEGLVNRAMSGQLAQAPAPAPRTVGSLPSDWQQQLGGPHALGQMLWLDSWGLPPEEVPYGAPGGGFVMRRRDDTSPIVDDTPGGTPYGINYAPPIDPSRVNNVVYGQGASQEEVDTWDFTTGRPKDIAAWEAVTGQVWQEPAANIKRFEGAGANAMATTAAAAGNSIATKSSNPFRRLQDLYNTEGNEAQFTLADAEAEAGGPFGSGEYTRWALERKKKGLYVPPPPGGEDFTITGTGKLDVEVGGQVKRNPDGSLNMKGMTKSDGFFGTGLGWDDVLNFGLGAAGNYLTGGPQQTTVNRRTQEGLDNPGGPLNNTGPSGTGRDNGSEVPKGGVQNQWFNKLSGANNSGRGTGPGGTPGTRRGSGPGKDEILGSEEDQDIQQQAAMKYATGTDAFDVGAASLEDILSEYFQPEFDRLNAGQGSREQELLDMIRTGAPDQSAREKSITDALSQGRPNFAQREQAILDLVGAPTDFSRIREELTTISQSVADEIFGAGGQVDEATQLAMVDSVDSGFGTQSGGFTRARQNILSGGRDVVGRSIAQNAAALAPLALEERGQNLGALTDVMRTLSPLEMQAFQTDVGARSDILRTMAPLDLQNRGLEMGTLADFNKDQTARLDALRDSMFTGQTTIEQLRMARETQRMNEMMVNQALGDGDTDWLSGIKDFVGIGASAAFAGKTIYDLFS